MARFDLYPNPNDDGYLLDVQTDLLSGLNTRLVVPLMPVANAPKPAMEINGSSYVMITQFVAAVPASILKTVAANLDENADDITNALDMVFFDF